ncbi:MAG TPA: HIT domain-containing protein [Candidatus Bathyarchaeia archaeon]|nr:HIT domain-containing protein [Candidatus Bathyarchaeia archaeon]
MQIEPEKCVFCKIISGTIPATVVAESENALAIRDIAPKAPMHYLFMPKVHINEITEITDLHRNIPYYLIQLIQEVVTLHTIRDYRLVINNGIGAGQSIFHLHIHLLAGEGPGSLLRKDL